MNYLDKIVSDIETHSVEGIKDCFRNGINPNDYYRNEPLFNELTSEYLRSPRFKECVMAFVDFGLLFNDPLLLAVLLDDAGSLANQLKYNPGAVEKRYTLRCAFTPLNEVTLLHVCAEFNHVSCAGVLVANGADINAKAGIDEYGFGGQTPLFHTVNQILNQSEEMLHFLLSSAAEVTTTIKGLIWGKGYEWETLIPSVNAISYTTMGLLPQMHRDEQTIWKVVTKLLKAAYNIDYIPPNIPNRYLRR